MKKEDCIRVVFLAQELQEDDEDGFRLTGWVNEEGEIAAAEYEDYITAWQEDEPIRQKRCATQEEGENDDAPTPSKFLYLPVFIRLPIPHPAQPNGVDIPNVFPDVPSQTEGQRQAAAAKKAKKAAQKKAAEAVKAAKKAARQKADPKGKGKARAATDDASTPEPETSRSSS